MESDLKKLISVIVPVYNSKERLEKCVRSILEQTYSKLEIIIIDDGSTDGSEQLCDSLADMDPRIKVIHKENGGQSDARNRGLDIASGEYIGFVDSDDTVAPGMYETLLNNIISYDAQISCCGTRMVYPDGKTDFFNTDISLFRVFSKKDALVEFTKNNIITASLWDKLYERCVFDNLRLKKGIIYEDFQLMPYCLLKADKVVYTGQPLYYYNVTSVSSIRGHHSTRLYDIVPVCAELVELYKDVCPEGVPGMENQYVDHCLTLFYSSYGDPAWYEKRNELKSILLSFNKEMLSSLLWDNRVKLGLMQASPELYMSFYRVLQKTKAVLRRIWKK